MIEKMWYESDDIKLINDFHNFLSKNSITLCKNAEFVQKIEDKKHDVVIWGDIKIYVKTPLLECEVQKLLKEFQESRK